MSWHPHIPLTVQDTEGNHWHITRAWPDRSPQWYVLEVSVPGLSGVRAGHLRSGRFELIPEVNDHSLPSLKAAAQHGHAVVHRAHKRAVIRGEDRYIKVFRAGRGTEAAALHRRMAAILDGGDFRTPEVIAGTPHCFTLGIIPGRSLFELGQDSGLSDTEFERIWQRWANGWVHQHTLVRRSSHRKLLEGLAARTPVAEARIMQRTVDQWLLHAEAIPAARTQRNTIRKTAAEITQLLLGTAPDPLTWSHGDLHDKQILAQNSRSPIGLLDFDGAARAEAAADLANLAVHLKLRLRQQRLTPARYRAARRHVIAAAQALNVTPARFTAQAAATQLRLACLYSFRPQWTALAADLLNELAGNGPGFPTTCEASPPSGPATAEAGTPPAGTPAPTERRIP